MSENNKDFLDRVDKLTQLQTLEALKCEVYNEVENIEGYAIEYIQENKEEFKGEQGIQGEKGDKGDKGDNGIDSITANNIIGQTVTIPNTVDGLVDDIIIINDSGSTLDDSLIKIESSGKNLLDFANATFYDADYGGLKFNINTTQNNIISKTDTEIQVQGVGDGGVYQGVGTLIKMPVGTYTLSASITYLSGTNPVSIRWATYANESDTQDGSLLINQGSSNNTIVITEANQWLIVGCYIDSSYPATTVSLSEMQLELGTTATDYAPYQEPQERQFILVDKYYQNIYLADGESIQKINGVWYGGEKELDDNSVEMMESIRTFEGGTTLTAMTANTQVPLTINAFELIPTDSIIKSYLVDMQGNTIINKTTADMIKDERMNMKQDYINYYNEFTINTIIEILEGLLG